MLSWFASTRMHEHYTPTLAEEKQTAARATFGHLKAVAGGPGVAMFLDVGTLLGIAKGGIA